MDTTGTYTLMPVYGKEQVGKTTDPNEGLFVVIVCGDRTWNDYASVYFKLVNLPKELDIDPSNLLVIEGGQTGADFCGQRAARSLGYKWKSFPAKWDRYGHSAGPIHNQEMLDNNPKPRLVLAFHRYIRGSKSTKDMVNRAIRASVKVQLWDGTWWSDLNEVVN